MLGIGPANPRMGLGDAITPHVTVAVTHGRPDGKKTVIYRTLDNAASCKSSIFAVASLTQSLRIT